MNKLLLVAVCLLSAQLALAQRFASTAFTCSTCTASGDPHWTSFDQMYHDFQGEGVFQYAKNDLVNVQATAQRCGGTFTNPVSCIRSVSVQIHHNTESYAGFSFGFWNNRFDAVKIWERIRADPRAGIVGSEFNITVTHQSLSVPRSVLFGKFEISFKGGRVQIAPKPQTISYNPTNAITVSVGAHYLAISLPNVEPHLFGTNGLCGFFDGAKRDEFRFLNGTAVRLPNNALRQNGRHINNWAMTFAAQASTGINRLQHWSHRAADHVELMGFELDQATVPTDDQLKDLFKVQFPDLTEAQAANDHCTKVLAGAATVANGDNIALQNCIMDYQGSVELATSNAEALRVANEQQAALTDSSTSSLPQWALITIICVGAVAGVALVVAGVMYARNRHLKYEVDRMALVVRNEGVAPSHVSEISL